MGPVPPQLRSLYAAADVLVVPSLATRTFREPWGLVVNEAMNRNLPVIASDAVGAVAGGLVRDGRNGLVVPAGDSRALADALRRLAADAPLRARLGTAGHSDVQAYTHDAWAQGFSTRLTASDFPAGGAGSVRHLLPSAISLNPSPLRRRGVRHPVGSHRSPLPSSQSASPASRRPSPPFQSASPASRRPSPPFRDITLALAAALVLSLLVAVPASASEVTKIYEDCGIEKLPTGFSQQAYNQAMKQMPPELAEYDNCPDLIQKAQLARATGGSQGRSAPTARWLPARHPPQANSTPSNAFPTRAPHRCRSMAK